MDNLNEYNTDVVLTKEELINKARHIANQMRELNSFMDSKIAELESELTNES